MASQERITVHNLADLKNTSDDAIPNYLNSLRFEQDHTLVDTRLALGYGAFAIAAACFLWDYKLGFDATKWYTAAAVALYTVVNGALTLWIAFVENGTVYRGTAPDGTKISVSTSTKKNEPTYYVAVEITPKKGAAGGPHRMKFARSFTEWFDAQGHFVARPFQTVLATTVPLIAKADPKRASSSSSSSSSSSAATAAAASSSPAVSEAATSSSDFLNVDPQTLDALAAAESTGVEAGSSSSSSGKKSKRRKA